MSQPDRKRKQRHVHVVRRQGHDEASTTPSCRFYLTPRGCRAGDACRFAHESTTVNAARTNTSRARINRVNQKQQSKPPMAKCVDTPRRHKHTQTGRHDVAKRHPKHAARGPVQSDPTSDAQTHGAVRHFEGFYYDSQKKRYFRLTPGMLAKHEPYETTSNPRQLEVGGAKSCSTSRATCSGKTPGISRPDVVVAGVKAIGISRGQSQRSTVRWQPKCSMLALYRLRQATTRRDIQWQGKSTHRLAARHKGGGRLSMSAVTQLGLLDLEPWLSTDHMAADTETHVRQAAVLMAHDSCTLVSQHISENTDHKQLVATTFAHGHWQAAVPCMSGTSALVVSNNNYSLQPCTAWLPQLPVARSEHHIIISESSRPAYEQWRGRSRLQGLCMIATPMDALRDNAFPTLAYGASQTRLEHVSVLGRDGVNAARQATAHRTDIMTLACAPNNVTHHTQALPALVGCRDGTVQQWVPREGHTKLLQLFRCKQAVVSVVPVADTFYVVTQSLPSTLHTWDLRNTARPVLAYHDHFNTHKVNSFHPAVDQRQELLACSDIHGAVRIWDFQSGHLRKVIHPDSDASVAFHEGGVCFARDREHPAPLDLNMFAFTDSTASLHTYSV
eukprot:m.68014 g.68014  ORF g.68014 m.68014 type:complete len:615 (-) comp12185_c1_seq1:2309-4153(-)